MKTLAALAAATPRGRVQVGRVASLLTAAAVADQAETSMRPTRPMQVDQAETAFSTQVHP
jgi:hypothetical protein